MSEVNLRKSTMVRNPQPSINPNPPRTRQTINTIKDFFQTRFPIQPVVFARASANLSVSQEVQQTQAPPQTSPALIPIQVIMEHPNLPVQSEPLHKTNNLRVLADQVSPLDLQTRLHQAQTLWAAMFRTTNTPIIANGNRPIILSIENQRANAPWGDPLVEKSANVTRIYGLNVNGLKLDQLGGQLDELCQFINEVQADVFCGQEHNLDSDNTQVRQILYQTTRKHWKRSRITFATTPIPFSKQYKPGGTFLITANDLTGRVIAQKQDKWGRWASQVYQGRGSIKIAIYSAYQVVAKEVKLGCITTASQQHSLLLQAQDQLTNPRSAFRRDITLAIQASLADGHEILLLGDFNEALGTDPDGIQKVAATCGLIDLMSLRHSSTPPATYARGKTLIMRSQRPMWPTHYRLQVMNPLMQGFPPIIAPIFWILTPRNCLG